MAGCGCRWIVGRGVAPGVLHGVVEQLYGVGELWAGFLVGDGAQSDSGCFDAFAVGYGEGAGGGSADVAGASPAGLVWAGGGADRARGEFVESVAAWCDSSVVPALETAAVISGVGTGAGGSTAAMKNDSCDACEAAWA